LSRRRDRRTPARPVVGALAGALLLLAVAGCSGSDFTSGDKGFVSVDKTVSIITEAGDRPEPQGEVAGETLDGDQVSLSDHRGRVVVIPVWGSWCGPCRAEAPMLADAARDLEGRGVDFLGIDSRDPDRTDPRAFVRRFGIPYPSIHDPDGATLLAFHGTLPPQTIPSFVIIDEQGRIAARVLGEIDRSTLYGVVSKVLGEDVPPPREKT
jgi:thiol-disulfide isomerase/thioredoxin